MEETLTRLCTRMKLKGFETATSTAAVEEIAIVDIVSMGAGLWA